MIKPVQPTLRDAAVAAGLTTACAIVMGVALASFSMPKGFNERLIELRQQIDQTGDLMRKAGGPRDVSSKAVCSQDPGQEGLRLRNVVSGYASQQNLSLAGLDIAPEGLIEPDARLIPLHLKFNVSGSYEAVLAMLDALSKLQPQVFADTVDLAPRTSGVTLTFSGRVYCSV